MRRMLLVVALLSPACSDDSPAAGPVPILDEEHPYALVQHPSWTLLEAVDYAADHPFTTVGRGTFPPVDWYAEYNHEPVELGNGAIRVDYVKVSAVDGGLERTATQYAVAGGPSEPFTDEEWVGRRGFDGGDLDAFVLLDGGEQTLVVDSPDLSTDEVIALLDHVVAVDASEWAEAGGVDVG